MNASEKNDNDDQKSEEQKKKPPLNAILPDDSPVSSGELLGDIDDYQKKIESDWESAKTAYHARIDQIMEDFLKENLPKAIEPETGAPTSPKRKPHKDENIFAESEAVAERLESLLAKAQRTVHRKSGRPLPTFDFSPDRLALPGPTHQTLFSNKIFRSSMAALLGLSTVVGGWLWFRLPAVSVLPYAHTSGPLIINHRLYVVDWFRKALVIHSLKKGLPVESIEAVPNSFATGFALTEKYFWTVDGFNSKILQHALTPEHEVLKEFSVPAKHPVGLSWDGTSLWSADDGAKVIYHHAPNSPDDILDTYQLPDMTITAFQVSGNRLWVLDGKTREITLFRLQKNLKPLATVDLDTYLNRGVPSGLFIDDSYLWLVTENPSRLVRLSKKKLPQ